MSVIDDLVAASSQYAGREGAELGAQPARGVAIVTCMDARILPSSLFDLDEGDAHVIRNAGGSAREALRSLAVSAGLLGTRAVMVVKHTDCGMLNLSPEKLREKLGPDADQIDFLPFADLEQGVRDDVKFLRDSPLIPGDIEVRGFVYDVRTRRLSELT